MKEKLERIPVNIWDDYYEEGYIPEGEIQETYMYIEEYDFISLEKSKQYLELLLEYMKNNLKLEGVKLWIELYDSKIKYPNLNRPEYENMHSKRYQIQVEHLTHERRYELVDELNNAKLTADGLPFGIYSES